ncbi:hypothetical protein K1719_008240 [Acacia pycnantha]|nr:hypothetical protein K1719_008240 [Acacia pycnantha]
MDIEVLHSMWPEDIGTDVGKKFNIEKPGKDQDMLEEIIMMESTIVDFKRLMELTNYTNKAPPLTIGPAGVDNHEVAPLSSSTEGNSGLLEAVLMESQALSRSDKRKCKSNDSSAGRKHFISKRKHIAEEKDKDINNEQLESDGKNNNNGEFQRDGLHSSKLSVGVCVYSLG